MIGNNWEYAIENRSQMVAMNGNYCILNEREVDFVLPAWIKPASFRMRKRDLSVAWTYGSIQVPRCYMIVLTMLVRRFLFGLLGFWKQAKFSWEPTFE